MVVNDDRIEFSMCLCATLAAVDVADVLGCDTTVALGRLLSSNVGSQIFDDSLKLWWESPRDVAVAYLEEAGLTIPSDWT